MMYEIERAIPTPQVEIIVQRRARRQVFRDSPPLTTGGENVHEAVHNLAHDHCAFVAAAPAWRDQRFDQFPFVVGEVAPPTLDLTLTLGAPTTPHRAAAAAPSTTWAAGQPRNNT